MENWPCAVRFRALTRFPICKSNFQDIIFKWCNFLNDCRKVNAKNIVGNEFLGNLNGMVANFFHKHKSLSKNIHCPKEIAFPSFLQFVCAC